MAQTSTAINGCDVVIKLDNDSGVLADISGSSNSVDINRLVKVSDGVYTFGSTFPVRKSCGKDAEISLKIIYSTEEAEAMQLLNDWYENHHQTTRTLQVDMPDSDPGSDRYTFEVLIESLKMMAEQGDPNPTLVDVVLKPTGTFTWAQIAS